MTVVRLELLPSQKTGEHVVTCQDPTLDGVVIDATKGHALHRAGGCGRLRLPPT